MSATQKLALPLTKEEIMRILPHRPPFLFVDEIIELVLGKRAVGVYAVKEEDCQGHFPDHPIMPGVLTLEVINQVGAVAILSLPENHGRIAMIIGADGLRFRGIIRPGDTIRAEVEKTREGRIGKCQGMAFVNDKRVVEAEILFTLSPGV